MFSWVNPKIEVRGAGSKGKGLFAKELIQKGEIVIVQGGQIFRYKDVDSHPFYEYCFSVDKGFDMCPAELDFNKIDAGYLINHSCSPNCGMKGQITFVAMRDIQKGEEIAFDYAMTQSDYEGMDCEPERPIECLCGSPNCRKIITGDDWRRKDLQEKYKGYFSPYLQKMIDAGHI